MSASNDTYTLTYFDLRGLAEQTRILFAISGTEYADIRLPMDTTTYARPEFDVKKAAGEFDINMGRVPLLTYNGADGEVTFGQSKSIERFVARKLGFYGSNENESALVDMIAEHVRDVKTKFMEGRAGKTGQDLSDYAAKFVAEELPVWFIKLEKTLSGSDGFAVGSKLSLADVAVHSLVRDQFPDKQAVLDAAKHCPRLLASAEKVHVAAAHWLETRKVTAF